jgi:hypothetical protein
MQTGNYPEQEDFGDSPDDNICPFCGEQKHTFCICDDVDDELGLEDELDDEEYDDEFQSRDSGL